MAEFIRRAWTWLILLFQEQEPIEPVVTVPKSVPKPARKLKYNSDDVFGQFYFKEQILDQLDDYFNVTRRMRKYDPRAYSLYSKIGAHILPYKFQFHDKVYTELSPWWKHNRPSFGAIALVHPEHIKEENLVSKLLAEKTQDKTRRLIKPRFMYFTKFIPGKQPIDVQPVRGGDIYVVTLYWQQHNDKWHDSPQEFPILIDENNTIQVLNVNIRGLRSVKSRRKGDRQIAIPFNRWGIHRDFVDWAEWHEMPVRDHLRSLFLNAASCWELAQYSMIRVDARKGSAHAVFGVDIRRTPYFFKDRELHVTINGNRKRIFHIVRAHRRDNGAFVKTHFRGERCFTWNGYEINITVPGKHHVNMPEFNVGAIDEEHRTSDAISEAHLGRMLQRHVEGTPLAEAFRKKQA